MIKINNFIKAALYLLFIVLVGCSNDTEEYDYSSNIINNPLNLEASSSSIALSPTNKNETAVIFTWELGRDRGPDTKITQYLFKLDIANNNFSTSIPAIEMEDGICYLSFTTKELNDLILNKWKIPEGNEAELEARIIALVEHPDLYIHPDYSTIKLKVKPYEEKNRPLFLVGDATDANWNPENALLMEELIPNELYSWRGRMSKGEFKILSQITSLYPCLSAGESSNDLILTEEENPDEEFFKIEEEGLYRILINTNTNQINIVKVYIEQVNLGGSATSAGWGVDRIPMTWSPYNPNTCTVKAELKSGELKFAAFGSESWGTRPAIRPMVPNASINSDTDCLITGSPDYKWRVHPEQAGLYLITIDTELMIIKFEKLN